MSLSLLIELAGKSALVAGLGLALLFLLRSRSAAERSRVAHAALAIVLLLPLALVTVPEIEIEAPASVAAMIAVPAPAEAGPAAPAALFAPPASLAPSTSLAEALPILALVPAAALLLLSLIAVLRLQLLRRRSEVLEDPRWLAALAAMQRRFGFKHGTALLVSRELSSPISWGVMRPVILLDERAAAGDIEPEAIIAHELAHVARLDWAKLLIGRLATALFWFNPLVWILAARCHELREEAADDAVLRTDVARADYAELLIGVARHENRGMLLAANGVAPRRGSLRRRILRVLDPSHSRVPARFGWTLACCAGALLVNAPLSALTLVGERAPAPQNAAAPEAADFAAAGVPPVTLAGRAQEPSPRPARAARPEPAGAASAALAAALIEAARRGDVPAMAQLLDSGANPDAAVPDDGSPLIAAAQRGQAAAVSFLLSRGADVDFAVRGDGNPLIAAAGAGRTDMVRLLLDRGANIEATVPEDENALITASRLGRLEVVRLLVARGADVNRRVDGRTPLSVARRGGHSEIATLLGEAGAMR